MANWVLVTDDGDGQNRSALAGVRALAAAGYQPAVSRSARRSLAGSSRHCRRVVLVPPVGSPDYAAAVEAELRRGGYLTVLPASDAALVALGSPGRELVDKEVLAARVAESGLPTLPWQAFESPQELMSAADDLEFPAVVKPAVKATRSPSHARRVRSAAELRALGVAGRTVVQRWADGTMHAVAGVVWRGELVASAHQEYRRTWPPECGVASAAVTVAPDEALEHSLVRLLDGYEGIFQAQFVDGYLVDVNPRVYGSLPLAVAAGANLVAVWCDLVRGERPRRRRARPGVHYRWLEGDLRALADGVRSGRSGPAEVLAALRPRSGTAHSVASVADPRPLMTRLSYALARRR